MTRATRQMAQHAPNSFLAFGLAIFAFNSAAVACKFEQTPFTNMLSMCVADTKHAPCAAALCRRPKAGRHAAPRRAQVLFTLQ